MVNELLERKKWVSGDEESKVDFIARIKLQHQQFYDLKRAHGQLYVIKFGEDDSRPMWEDQISMAKLKAELRTPLGTEWDCPLCQPYDKWSGTADIESNRRFMCRIIAPDYVNGCIEDVGVLKKCSCILKPKYRRNLKLKP